MNFRTMRQALLVAFFAATLPVMASAQTYFPAQSGEKWWNPETRDGASRFNRVSFEGRWVVQDRFDTKQRGNGRWGGATLPDFVKIDQGRRVVQVTDRRNNLLQVIGIRGGYRAQRQDALFLEGNLMGTRIVAHGQGPRGQHLTQTMTLRNRGQILVVTTRVERGRSGRTVEIEKIYQRA